MYSFFLYAFLFKYLFDLNKGSMILQNKIKDIMRYLPEAGNSHYWLNACPIPVFSNCNIVAL